MPSRGKVLITLGAIALIGATSVGAATLYREQKKQKDFHYRTRKTSITA